MLPKAIERIQIKLDKINTSITPGELEEIRKIVMVDESIDNMTEVFFFIHWSFIVVFFFLILFNSHYFAQIESTFERDIWF